MILTQQISRLLISLCLVPAISTPAFAQRNAIGGPLTGLPVLGAPFSAEATTTVRQTLGDGGRIERTGTARYYRDREGRVRVEQTILGLEALNPAANGQVRITIQPEPEKSVVFTLDPVTRTANPGPRNIDGLAVGGGDTYALPLGGPRWRFLVFSRGERLRSLGAAGKEESLGSRQIAGVEVMGRRITMTVPVDVFGNDRPFEIVDERWESPELKLLIYSRSSDPRTGVIDYRLTNIRRAEPPADLFVIPPDYTIESTGDNGWTTLEYAERANSAGGRRR
jgi:hypothetical protein